MSSGFFEAQRAHRAGDLRVAEQGYRRILANTPAASEALHYLGLLTHHSGRLAEGETLLKKSVCCAPATAVFWMNLGSVLLGTGEIIAAEQAAERAVRVDPASRDTVYVFATVLRGRGDFAAAHLTFRRALCLAPADFDVILSAAVCLKDDREWRAALVLYARCLHLRPADPDVLYSRAHCYLPLGDFGPGWQAYEHRFAATINATHAREAHDLLTGKPRFARPSPRSRVLAWAEQGVGDEIMFGGLLREFRSFCGELTVQVDARLVALFARSMPEIRFVARGTKLAPSLYDEQLPMGSLGRWLRPTADQFEGRGGRYLRADEARVGRIRVAMGLAQGDRVIGLSWRSAAPETGAARSLALVDLLAALRTDGTDDANGERRRVHWVNLQYGDTASDIAAVRDQLGIEIWSASEVDNRDDLDGLASLIEVCDEVVSVGNATAHLAGALGKRSCVLLPYVAGWRWLHEGSRCPWYDSVTLLRQKNRGDWRSVLVDLREYLR